VVRLKALQVIGALERYKGHNWSNRIGLEAVHWVLTRNAGHTISQRLRQLRKIPPELIPLGTLDAIS
jgi:hypothetical protein